jgi:hypothetical protein
MWLKAHRKRSSGSGGITVVSLATSWSRSKMLSPWPGTNVECSWRSSRAKWIWRSVIEPAR